jgi:hypothetical protein
VDEESPDFCRFDGRIEKAVLAISRSVAAKERSSPAPATAGKDALIRLAAGILNDKVSPVGNDLGIDPEDSSERALQLSRRIIAGLKDAHGMLD